MTTVTNGVVEYGRTVKPADYESKSAKVSLSFAIEDGSDPEGAVATVMDMCIAEVHSRLGLAVAATSVMFPTIRTQPVEAPKAEKPKQKPPVEVPAINPTSQVDASVAAPGANARVPPSATVPTSDPLAIEDPGEEEPKPLEISNKEIQAAARQTMERGVSYNKVKALIEELHGGVVGKSMTLFDQPTRVVYLKRLKELQP